MKVNEEKLQILDDYLKQCVAENVFPGVDYGLILPDRKYFLYEGNKQIVPEVISNNHDTIWDLASISKVLVTTTCILKLMEEGIITLKTRIKEVIEEFENEEITIIDNCHSCLFRCRMRYRTYSERQGQHPNRKSGEA